MKTGDVLQAMLTEDTGKHFLDSGGVSGRSWQQNKGRDFASEPAATLTVEEGFIDIRRSTYHFLRECLEFDQPMTDQFLEFCKEIDAENRKPWLPLMEEFVEWLEAVGRFGEGFPPKVTGIYGEGLPLTINTYNHDSLLDQVIQYVYFELDEKGYVLLQIHGGCDVRGGYTAPKAFRCNIDNSPSIFSDGEAVVVCRDSEHRWYVQDGSWDTDHEDDPKANETRGLGEFPIIADEAEYHRLRRRVWVEPEVNTAFGVIWQDASGVHCPLCGEVLEVW